MAWRSSGETNEELVTNMTENGLISSPEIEEAFRKVDRKHFVPEGYEDQAYSDRPIRKGHVHISAPHIYCTVLEALDLHPGTSISFLNIGSGSGYLSCIVSEILGPKSLYYEQSSKLFHHFLDKGIEIHEDTLTHCQNSVCKWYEDVSITRSQPRPMMHFLHGNGLDVEPDVGECIHGFDRIYAGAAISLPQLRKVQLLLRPGGVLVAPVEDELLKVVRTRTPSSTPGNDMDVDENNYGFETQTISGVTFASLLAKPQIRTVIPATKWSIENHRVYPESFQKATRTILLCRNSNVYQPIVKPTHNRNFSASIPKEVWMHILSFTTRMWFEPENLSAETEMLQSRLIREQRNLNRTRSALCTSETRNLLLEHQNEMYLEVARQLYDSVQEVMRHTSNEANGGGIHLSRERILATQSLLERSRTLLYPRGSRVLGASYELMEEEENESDSDEDMVESIESDNEPEERPMVESASNYNQSNENNTRQLRTVSISSADL